MTEITETESPPLCTPPVDREVLNDDVGAMVSPAAELGADESSSVEEVVQAARLDADYPSVDGKQVDDSFDKEAVMQRHVRPVESERFIYAVGVLAPVFPNKGIQSTFESAARCLDVSEKDYYAVFSHREGKTRPYFYIAEQIDWVLSINEQACYRIIPRAKRELMGFIDSLKAPESSLQPVYSTVVGVLAESGLNSTGMLPTVVCNHIYSQTMDELNANLNSEKGVTTSAIQDVLKQLEFSPNQGDTDFTRAKNFLAFQYPDIYLKTHALKQSAGSQSSDRGTYFLDDIRLSYSDLMSSHVIVDMVFTYKSKALNREQYYFCSVDVSKQFPFINTPLQSFMPATLRLD